jgi:hypothetical protein
MRRTMGHPVKTELHTSSAVFLGGRSRHSVLLAEAGRHGLVVVLLSHGCSLHVGVTTALLSWQGTEFTNERLRSQIVIDGRDGVEGQLNEPKSGTSGPFRLFHHFAPPDPTDFSL